MAKATYVTFLFSLLLKGFSLTSFLVGIGFIAFGCVLQSPPKTFVPGCALPAVCTWPL
jgi:hypothetical protein